MRSPKIEDDCIPFLCDTVRFRPGTAYDRKVAYRTYVKLGGMESWPHFCQVLLFLKDKGVVEPVGNRSMLNTFRVCTDAKSKMVVIRRTSKIWRSKTKGVPRRSKAVCVPHSTPIRLVRSTMSP